MVSQATGRPSTLQQAALITLRTLIGWHFLYEAYYKLALPGWSRLGVPIAAWTSAGYLKAATGPLGKLFQKLLDAGWGGRIDTAVKWSLLLIGLSLLLGLFTRVGAYGALILLLIFYLVSVPLSGTQVPGSEGAYLLVNKTLIEAAAVCVLLAFHTERLAGLDLLLAGSKSKQQTTAKTQVEKPVESTPAVAKTNAAAD